MGSSPGAHCRPGGRSMRVSHRHWCCRQHLQYYSICEHIQYICKYWDGNAVYCCSPSHLFLNRRRLLASSIIPSWHLILQGVSKKLLTEWWWIPKILKLSSVGPHFLMDKTWKRPENKNNVLGGTLPNLGEIASYRGCRLLVIQQVNCGPRSIVWLSLNFIL